MVRLAPEDGAATSAPAAASVRSTQSRKSCAISAREQEKILTGMVGFRCSWRGCGAAIFRSMVHSSTGAGTQHRVLQDVIAQARSEGNADTKLITLIIPVRLSDHRLYDETERMRRIASAEPSDVLDVLIVDYGSSRRAAGNRLRPRASVRIEVSGPFSAGLARDQGALHAWPALLI